MRPIFRVEFQLNSRVAWNMGGIHLTQLRPSTPVVEQRALSPMRRTCPFEVLQKDCMNLIGHSSSIGGQLVNE